MKVYTKIYLLIDSHGNKAYATVEDSSDCAQICGLSDKSGKETYFESEAYHISSYCEYNDIQLRTLEREEEFDDLWGTAKTILK